MHYSKVRWNLPALLCLAAVSVVGASECHTEGSHPQLVIDSSRCERRNLKRTDILLLARQILQALPEHSDPPPMVLSATCLPPAEKSYEVAPGGVVQLPDAAVWVFIAQGFHEKRVLSMPNHSQPVHMHSPRIERIPGPGAQKPQMTWSLGYYLAYDRDARPAGFGPFGPPATILNEE